MQVVLCDKPNYLICWEDHHPPIPMHSQRFGLHRHRRHRQNPPQMQVVRHPVLGMRMSMPIWIPS